MDDDRLSIYINDHLALLVAEVELAERCHRTNERGELGSFLEGLIKDVTMEQETLKNMLRCLGSSQSIVKQGLAWFAEKAGRFKLNDSLLTYSQLSRLIELETLFIAAVERQAFWENVKAARPSDARFAEFDFSEHQRLVERHVNALRALRIEAAAYAF